MIRHRSIAILLKQKGGGGLKFHLKRGQRHTLIIHHRLFQPAPLPGINPSPVKFQMHLQTLIPMLPKIFLLYKKHPDRHDHCNE